MWVIADETYHQESNLTPFAPALDHRAGIEPAFSPLSATTASGFVLIGPFVFVASIRRASGWCPVLKISGVRLVHCGVDSPERLNHVNWCYVQVRLGTSLGPSSVG